MGNVKSRNKKTFPGVPPFQQGLGDRLHTLRRKLGLSQDHLSKMLGRSNNNAVSRLERGEPTVIPCDILERLLRLAEEAGYTAEWLLTGRLVSPAADRDALLRAHAELLAQEIMTRSQARAAPEAEIPAEAPTPDSAAETAARTFQPVRIYEPGFRLIAPEEIPQGHRKDHLPVLGRLAAGEGVDTVEAETRPPGIADAYIYYKGAPPGAFALRVLGESMMPRYGDGDLVIIDPARAATSGVCCVIYEDDAGDRLARLKVLSRHGKSVLLQSINPEYAPVRLARRRLLAAYKVAVHLPWRTVRPA